MRAGKLASLRESKSGTVLYELGPYSNWVPPLGQGVKFFLAPEAIFYPQQTTKGANFSSSDWIVAMLDYGFLVHKTTQFVEETRSA